MSMLHDIETSHAVPTGIGLGLRARFLDRVAEGEAHGVPAFVELSPENYMHRGGKNPARLEQVAARFPVICHGLMMSLASTDPFDPDYFAFLKGFLDRWDPPWHSDHVCWSGLDGALLHEAYENKKRMNPHIADGTPIEALFEVAREAGAAGGKICGAGGGGYLLLACTPGRQPQVRSALEAHGGALADFAFSPLGVQARVAERVWRPTV